MTSSPNLELLHQGFIDDVSPAPTAQVHSWWKNRLWDGCAGLNLNVLPLLKAGQGLHRW
jgi:hypothetical protein